MSASKRASGDGTPVKGMKAGKKGLFGSPSSLGVLTVLPRKGKYNPGQLYKLEGDVVSISRKEDGRVGVCVMVDQEDSFRVWYWMKKEEAELLGVGLAAGCRVGLQNVTYYTNDSGYCNLGSPAKGTEGGPAKVKLLGDTRDVTPLSDLVLDPVNKSKEHYLLGLIGGRVVDESREYMLLWNLKTAECDIKCVAVLSYFGFIADASVGKVVICGPVLHLEAGLVKTAKTFKIFVQQPGVSIRPSAAAFVKLHDAAFMETDAAKAAKEFMSDWEDRVKMVTEEGQLEAEGEAEAGGVDVLQLL